MNSDNYEDIINLPRPASRFGKPMPLERRAAQFAPFAALTGHNDAIAETGRLTDCRIELTDHEQARLSACIASLVRAAASRPAVRVCYFRPDARKTGGAYVEISGRFARLLPDERLLVLDHGRSIPLPDIISLEILK